MNVEAVSFKKFYKNKENIYKNIMLVSKRARQLVDQRFMEMEALLNIEDTEQLNEIDSDIIGKPKSISIAMDELLDSDLEYSTFSNENEENDYYRLGNRPLTLGIAGNSGVGKSTFSSSLTTIFGRQSTLQISGDDYHNWDRSSPMWKTFTHLDPKANRLFQLVKDVRSLINGRAIKSRSYDHLLGYFLPNKISKSEDVIIVEGLHALYPKQLLVELDVCFFIEMDESLRLFLRTRRDVKERGHTEQEVLSEMERRKSDNEKYIKPQASRADVIFTLMPINIELFEQYRSIKSNIKVRACIKHGIYYSELVKVLIGVCGLQVNIESVDEKGEVVLEISGDVLSEDVNLAANILVPHMEELFDFSVEFSEGVQGIMQIITLMEIDEALKRRRNP